MRKELIGIYKKNIERRTGLKLDFVNNEDNYIIGKKYFCGYWQEIFEVLDYKKVKDLGVVTIKWQDGRIVSNCTSLNNNDFIVVE